MYHVKVLARNTKLDEQIYLSTAGKGLKPSGWICWKVSQKCFWAILSVMDTSNNFLSLMFIVKPQLYFLLLLLCEAVLHYEVIISISGQHSAFVPLKP